MAFPNKFLVCLYLATKVSSIKVGRHRDHIELMDWQVPVYFLPKVDNEGYHMSRQLVYMKC